MLPVLTAEAMRAADERTINDYGIPARTLMETAGRAVARAAEHELDLVRPGPRDRVVCVCGTGNNGGDGFVVARVLFEAGYSVDAVLVGSRDRLPEAAAANLRLLDTLAVEQAAYRGNLRVIETGEAWGVDHTPGTEACLLIDALLGTGVSGAAREPLASWIRAMNGHVAPVVAVDIPSGLETNSGRLTGDTIRAVRTVTLGALKPAVVLDEGRDCAGTVETAPIGIPGFILDDLIRDSATWPGCAGLITRDDVTLPTRGPSAHKYSAGLVVAVCGSAGLAGAAVMSTTAAMRVGAGAVKCATGASTARLLADRLTEVMPVSLVERATGLDPESTAEAVLEETGRASALLIGCGLGRGDGTVSSVLEILGRAETPTVLDADGLFAASTSPGVLAAHAAVELVLTPHRGEFERLVGERVDWHDRIEIARAYAKQWNCVLLLKGLPSVVAAPDGRVAIGNTATPALATAGSGDVLAGMVAGFVAQGLKGFDAAVTALYVGGVAADQFAAERAAQSMMATDLLAALPHVMARLADA